MNAANDSWLVADPDNWEDTMSLLIELNDLPGDEAAHRFVGADHGGVPVSFFLVHAAPGVGPELHRHPYPEVFVIEAGEASFHAADSETTAIAGQIVVVPAGAPHRFTNTGLGQLRLTAIHPADRMDTEWLQ